MGSILEPHDRMEIKSSDVRKPEEQMEQGSDLQMSWDWLSLAIKAYTWCFIRPFVCESFRQLVTQ